MNSFLSITLSFILAYCQNVGTINIEVPDNKILIREGTSIETRFLPPEGYERLEVDPGSFAYFLRIFPLKPHGSKVHYYNENVKRNNQVAAAVLDISVGQRDLQQCADAVIRLRAEYLRASGQDDKIVFNFTNGTPASWPEWKDGYRCFVNGNKVEWRKTTSYSDDDQTFSKYLETVFMYAGSLSLEKELDPAKLNDILPGDVFIEGGSPGHAVLVVDVAVNEKGERLFMLAQSYMPAQDIHILNNYNERGISPWYRLEKGQKLYTPEWTFEPGTLKKF